MKAFINNRRLVAKPDKPLAMHKKRRKKYKLSFTNQRRKKR